MAARYQDRLVIGAWQNNGWILHKYDNAEASVIQDEVRLNRMKTTYLKMNWLIPLLGISSSRLVVFPMAETTTTGRRAWRARTMPATRVMAAADSTDVPPNFMTIMSRASLPNASARHSVRPRRPRRGWCCG